MAKISPVRVLRRKITGTLVVVLSCALTLSAQPSVKSKQSAITTQLRNKEQPATLNRSENRRRSNWPFC